MAVTSPAACVYCGFAAPQQPQTIPLPAGAKIRYDVNYNVVGYVPAGKPMPVDAKRRCFDCQAEWCEYLDAYHGKVELLRKVCYKCRRKLMAHPLCPKD